MARIRTLLRRPHEVLPARLVAGELTLDPTVRRVWRGGREIELTAKEFALLELFMRNAGDVLTRDQILEHLWDFDLRLVQQRRRRPCQEPAKEDRPWQT